jgi:hypothetical protein
MLRVGQQCVLGLCLALAAIGCQQDLPRASEITHMRVLGAQTRVGESARTTPKPGEVATVTWSVVFPDVAKDNSELESLFVTCTAPKTFSGTPICQELVDIAQGGNVRDILGNALDAKSAPDCGQDADKRAQLGPFSIECVSNTPRLQVKIPEDYAADARLIRGVICRNGTPKLDGNQPTGVRCEPHRDVKPSDVESIAVYGTVPVEYDETEANDNPDLEGATQFMLGVARNPWPEIPADQLSQIGDDCSAAAADRRIYWSDGLDDEIDFAYDADARERYQGKPEALQFASYVTEGKLSRRFTAFAADAKPDKNNRLTATLDWQLTKEQRDQLVGQTKLVRFYFVLTDHRGGFEITRREVCVGRDPLR